MIARLRAGLSASVGATALLVSAAAFAQAPLAAPPLQPPAPAAFAAGRIEWRPEFRRVAWPEYVAVPVLWTGVLVEAAFLKTEEEVHWRGPILFDRALQHGLRASSARGRSRADTLSNVLLASSALQLALVDPWIVGAWLRRRPDVAWQLTVIDSEIVGLTEFANRLTKRLTARERPYGERCDADPDIDNCQAGTRYRSFFSGHASATSTFAGLTCAHHQKLALYGSFGADLAACLGSLGVSLTTGLLRVVADDHWASDVLVGHLVGFSAGYLLTWALYYPAAAPPSESRPALLAPIVGSGVWGLALGGQL